MPLLRRSLVALLLASCGSSPGPSCAPLGIEVLCRCSDGQEGVAVCTDHGLTACDCVGLDGGTRDAAIDGGMDAYVEDVGPGDAQLDDAATADTTVDALLPDTGLPDTGLPDSGGADTSVGDAGAPIPPFATTWDGTMSTDGVCDFVGWCWVDPPVPQIYYVDVASDGPNDLWAIADVNGAIVHFDGTNWTGALNGISGARRISAAAPDAVWVLTNATTRALYFFDGTRWAMTAIPAGLPPLREIWAAAPDDAWAVGDQGTVLRWDGTSWSVVDAGFVATTDLRAVHGASTNDVWIAGTGGAVRHFDGTTWTDRSVTSGDVVALWATSATDVWAGGARLQRWNGSMWSAYPLTGVYDIVGGSTIWVAAGGSGGNTLHQLNGAAFTNYYDPAGGVLTSGSPHRFHLAVDSDLVVALDARSPFGAIPAMTLARRISPGGALDSLHGRRFGTTSILALGPDDLLISSGTRAYRGSFDGSFVEHPELAGHGYFEAADGIGDIWTLESSPVRPPTSSYVNHWDGTSWLRTLVEASRPVACLDMDGSSAWAVSNGHTYRYTSGSTWTLEAGAADAALVVAGAGGTAFSVAATTASYFDGTAWSAIGNPMLDVTSLGYYPHGDSTSVMQVALYGGAIHTFATGAWSASPRAPGFARVASTVGATTWAISQGVGGGASAVYWSGDAWYGANLTIDGELRPTEVSVERDPDGRTWVLFGSDPTSLAVLEWRPR